MSGGDPQLTEMLSRYKTEADLAKAFSEQRKKLSERPSVMASLPDDATPEQIAEFREARGVPAEATLEAYGVKAPDGYDFTDSEKQLLGSVVEDLHAKNMGKDEVNAVIDHYFRAQTASIQAMRESALSKRDEWQRELKGELGKDYDATIASCDAYLDNIFGDDTESKTNLLSAQLPGGGILADNPQFVRMVADLALQNGFTDRIEANSYESGGKSLGEQQAELEALRLTAPERYNAPETQAKLDKIIGLRLSRGEIDELGNPVKRR